MRRAITMINLIGSFIVFGLTIGLFDTLVMFLLFGLIPGRDVALSATQMLTFYGVLVACIAAVSMRGSVNAIAQAFKSQRRSTSA